MQGIKVQDGSVLDFKPEEDTPAGAYVGINNICGFVPVAVGAGEPGALEPCGGKGSVWKVPKALNYGFSAGEAVYYDPVADAAVPVGTTTGFLLGYAVPEDGVWTSSDTPVEVAGASDEYVWVYTGQGTAT